MPTANFNSGKCYFTEKGKLDDLFNGDFRLYAEIEIEKAETLFFIIKWGNVYILLCEVPLSCESYPCSGTVEIAWTEPGPTIEQFLEMVGESIPEKQTEYDYGWILGYKKGETEFELMDTLNASLTVEFETKLPKGLLIGCGTAAVGLYSAGSIIGKRGGYLATPLKLAAIIPVGIGAWKGGEWVYKVVKSKI